MTVLSDADPGGEIRVRSNGDTWPARWMGVDSVRGETELDVELEIESIESIVEVFDLEIGGGIRVVDGKLTAYGKVSTVFDDGILVLQVDSGAVMIEPDLSSRVQEGQSIRVEPVSISLYPTGI